MATKRTKNVIKIILVIDFLHGHDLYINIWCLYEHGVNEKKETSVQINMKTKLMLAI